MNKELAKYVKVGHYSVDGWLYEAAIGLLVRLSNLQGQMNIEGPVCEIGVHHGKSFILLHLLTRNNELSVAWDLFERQSENVDKSGCGDKDIFFQNLKNCNCDLKRIKVNSENSLNLTEDKIESDCGGKVRIFSIDGGHTSEITYNDLRLAAKTLRDGGIVILDDFFNEAWPGVAEGTCKYMLSGDSGLVPVAIGGNKLVLTNNPETAKFYIDGLRNPGDMFDSRVSTIFGSKVLILLPRRNRARRYLTSTKFWKSVRGTPVSLFVRRMLRHWSLINNI